jgi:hypothetical protein
MHLNKSWYSLCQWVLLCDSLSHSTDDLNAFAALRADGSIVAWGDSFAGGADAPNGKGYTKIYSTKYAFVALKADGSITAWGRSGKGGTKEIRGILTKVG